MGADLKCEFDAKARLEPFVTADLFENVQRKSERKQAEKDKSTDWQMEAVKPVF